MLELSLFLQTAIQTGTHILLAVLGGILCEKAGNMNLGIEGMMLLGASIGYYVGGKTGSPGLAILAAGLAGASGALLYALITITFRGNQVVTGLVLAIFGAGVAKFLGGALAAIVLPGAFSAAFGTVKVPLLSKIPVLGIALFQQSPWVLASIALAFLLYAYFRFTPWGHAVRATGEAPAVADSTGINVTLVKYAHVLAGGFLCGLGGAYLSLVFVPRWQENITAGAGWIAVALVIFSTWNPLRAIYSAWLFGALTGLGFKLQGLSFSPFGHKIVFYPQILDMLPYMATIAVLALITRRKKKEYQAPASLGQPYFREER